MIFVFTYIFHTLTSVTPNGLIWVEMPLRNCPLACQTSDC